MDTQFTEQTGQGDRILARLGKFEILCVQKGRQVAEHIRSRSSSQERNMVGLTKYSRAFLSPDPQTM